jgi:hypothetical protein
MLYRGLFSYLLEGLFLKREKVLTKLFGIYEVLAIVKLAVITKLGSVVQILFSFR